MTEPIIKVGTNCWRRESAGRVAFLVDAADYFAALHAALQSARESVWILGWDIHSKMALLPEADRRGAAHLADVLDAATRRNRRLRVSILIWDPAPIYVAEREFAPLLKFTFRTGPQVKLRFASDHVVGASHHQKIVAIDDRLAFVGGIDLTAGRWDTREHRPNDERRTTPWGDRYHPFHDVQVAVDGDAARALGELARSRWYEAVGEKADVPESTHDLWPDSLEPNLRDVGVAFARTRAGYQDRPVVREVERLFLDAIAAARRSIYAENQYLTSNRLSDALADRLSQEDGPEVLIVTPKQQAGRLAERTMGGLRVRIVQKLRAADRYSRLRVMGPVVEGGLPVNVHAKVMVIDDQLVRIGSANLSNRSMGLDTECDVAIEAGDDDDVRKGIEDFRDGLIAEHLGASVEDVGSELQRHGSLLKVVDALRGGPRTLEDLTFESPATHSTVDSVLADPERPFEETLATRVIPEDAVEGGHKRFSRVALTSGLALMVGAVAAWWSFSGQSGAAEFVAVTQVLKERAWGPPLAAVFLALATLFMLPVNALIVAVVLVFGPWVGAAVSMTGSLISAGTAYCLGRLLWRDTVRRLAGRRLRRLSRQLGERGIMAVAAMRLVPGAPFTVANLVAGSTQIGFWDFLLGTLIGMAPGITILAMASDRLMAAARRPSSETILQAAVAVLLLTAGAFWLYRFLRRQSSRREAAGESQNI